MPGAARSGITAVVRRMIEAPGTFDRDGWLEIGSVGHQPSIRDSYNSTGSLYICLTGLLHLGSPADSPFWLAPAADWTQKRIWSGQDIAREHALEEGPTITKRAKKFLKRIWKNYAEVGSLNALSNPSRAAALALATRGEVFDLGLTYSRRSYKWPGHSPGEIITFRSPDGVHRMKDPDAPPPEQNHDRWNDRVAE